MSNQVKYLLHDISWPVAIVDWFIDLAEAAIIKFFSIK